MKLITALIPPERLEATKEELGKARIFRLTVMDVQGVAVGGHNAIRDGRCFAVHLGTEIPQEREGYCQDSDQQKPEAAVLSHGALLPVGSGRRLSVS